MSKTLGIYAGSFNPFHVGHANILHQAQNVFDNVIVAIGRNTAKSNKAEPFPEDNDVLRGSKVVKFNGLLSDYLNQLDFELDGTGTKVVLIRGLRNGDDLQYEQNQLQFIKEMYPSLLTALFICDKKFEHISSTALRALKEVSEKEYTKYVFSTSTPRRARKLENNDGWGWGK